MTGDFVINSHAPILIMTTEIYRNMLLCNDPSLEHVSYVVFDEIHYINDIERGTIWEESLIFSPESIRFLCLSATIPNAHEFAHWIETIKEHKVHVVSNDKRVVPLKHLLFDSYLGMTDIASVQKHAKEIENMIVRKNRHHLRWDDTVTETTLKDIKLRIFRDYIKKVKAAGRVRISSKETPKILKKLGLMRGKKLLNAANALFSGRNFLEVQFAVFAGREKLTFLDIKQVKGNIFELLEQCEEYIKDRINWRVKFGKLEREEIPEIPLDALREALLNSFCHRDYTISKGNEICLFRDRIEIYNPGSFPEGLTPKDFIKGEERSVLRNPLIAEIFYYSKDIEKFGTGLKRIYDECRDDKVKVEFKVIKTGFVAVFYRKGALDEGSQNRLGAKLGANEARIIEAIAHNPNITLIEMSRMLKISDIAVYKNIKKLKQKG